MWVPLVIEKASWTSQHVIMGKDRFCLRKWKTVPRFLIYIIPQFSHKRKTVLKIGYYHIIESSDKYLTEGKAPLILTCLINSTLPDAGLRPVLGFLRGFFLFYWASKTVNRKKSITMYGCRNEDGGLDCLLRGTGWPHWNKDVCSSSD